MEFWRQGMKLADVEKLAILEAFHFFQGNKTRTAAALDIAIRTLDAKLAIYLPKGEKEENVRRQDTGNREANRAVYNTVSARIHMESNGKIPQEQPMSVRQPEEIQEVLSTDHSKSNTKRRHIQKGVA